MKRSRLFLFAFIALYLTACTAPPYNTNPAYSGVESPAATESSETSSEKESEKQTPVTPNPTFRNTVWEMRKDEVKKCEDAEFVDENEEGIAYEDTLLNLNTIILYNFDSDGKLYRAGYLITEKHSYENSYIDDYNSLLCALKEKYGTPEDEKTIWRDDLYKDNPEDWGFAVSLGHLIYKSNWETDETKITLGLTGDNYECTLVVQYEPTIYQPNLAPDTDGL